MKRVPIIIMLAQSIIDKRVSPIQIDRFNYVSRQFTMITHFLWKKKERNEMLYFYQVFSNNVNNSIVTKSEHTNIADTNSDFRNVFVLSASR